MDELFFRDVTPQTGKLDLSSIRALQHVHFMGQPLLNREVPDFSDNTYRRSAASQMQELDTISNRKSLALPLEQYEKVYSRPNVPNGQIPPITYSRTLYRKSDYSAYNKQLPEMPTFCRSDKVISQSGLFITPPQSPMAPAPTPVSELESIPIQRNFSRKFTKREVKRIPGHTPVIQRSKTVESEAADIKSGSCTPVSTISALTEADRASFILLADSLKRSLTLPSPVKEKDASSK